MSRAFVKEGDGGLDPLPDLPVSPHPNYVTPAGLAALQNDLAAAQARLATLRARSERLDKLPEAAAERDIRYVEARLRSALLIEPASQPPGQVAFGLWVTTEDATGATATYQIVGEDEARTAPHRIAPQSPLARALMGAEVGDEVLWPRPSGAITLTVKAVSLADPDA